MGGNQQRNNNMHWMQQRLCERNEEKKQQKNFVAMVATLKLTKWQNHWALADFHSVKKQKQI